jgi:iron complex outermembrane recepter protein
MLSRNALILSTISLTALAASPAYSQAAAPLDTTPQKAQDNAQTPPSGTTTNAEGQAANKGAIVITGSRIRRDNFSTPQNVDIVTRQDQVLAGTRTTAETLQSATITSGTSQISGSFLGFVSEGGQAANTVGLRGLGSNRTLVLLNGRRLAPAGVGNQLVAADLNVLPTSIIQRIEVLREGASSIYGSDAIAGVINVITDTSLNGVTIDGFADHPLAGNGDTLRGSITAGKTFSRGHITGSFEYRETEGLRQNDRAGYSCPRDLFTVNGQEVGQIDPGTGQLRCFPFAFDSLGIASGYGISFNFNNGALHRISYPGYASGNPDILGAPAIVDPLNLRPSPGEPQLHSHIISPVKTYTGYLNGAYDLGILGDSELYGEALFTRRTSHQDFATQLNFDTNQLGSNVQLFGGHIAGYTIDELFGLSPLGTSYASPFFPTAWDAAGINYFTPFIMPQQLGFQKQRVDFFRGNAGLRGNLGIGDWRYDANFQVSRTRAVEDVFNPTSSHLANALIAVPAPAGTPDSVITVALPGQAGAGTSFTCASNVTNGAYNGGSCVPLNFYDPNILLFGRIPDNVYNYIYQNNYNHTKFNQDTAQLVFDGTLFRLPGGDAKGAIGFEHRRDYIKDVPSAAALAGELYNRASAGVTKGSDIVNEGFGEVDLPFFKDRPFLHLLELDVSGRYTHYRSYGSDFTYHLNAQWAPVAAIRFRGNYGTNFRAPNLYEQFVAAQTGFYPPSIDPCSSFGTQTAPGTARYNNCLAALSPILGQAGALAYVSTGGPQVTTTGGAGNLKSEHAKTWGVGTVFTMPRRIADFSLAVDYWNINVKDEVSILNNNILNLCYDSADFPNNVYCQLIAPRAPATAAHPGQLVSFLNPYINVATQQASGIDFDARFAARLLGGRFQTQLQATRNLHQKLELFKGNGIFDYNGTLGYPGFGAGPKWVGQLDTRFTTSNNITIRWGVKYVGKQDSRKLLQEGVDVINGQIPLPGIGLPPGTLGDFDLVAEPYWEHGVSVQWQWPQVGQFTIGVKNLFNHKPPVISGFPTSTGQYFRIGNFFGSGDYDYYGRSLFVNVTRSFK